MGELTWHVKWLSTGFNLVLCVILFCNAVSTWTTKNDQLGREKRMGGRAAARRRKAENTLECCPGSSISTAQGGDEQKRGGDCSPPINSKKI